MKKKQKNVAQIVVKDEQTSPNGESTTVKMEKQGSAEPVTTENKQTAPVGTSVSTKKEKTYSKAERAKERLQNSQMMNALAGAMLNSPHYTPDQVQTFVSRALYSAINERFHRNFNDRVKTRRLYGKTSQKSNDMVENLFQSQPSWYDRIIPGYDMILCGVLFQPPFVSLNTDAVEFSMIQIHGRTIMYQVLHRDDILQMGSTITRNSSAMPHTDTNYWLHIITDHIHELLIPLTRRDKKGDFINPLLRRVTDPDPNENYQPDDATIAINLMDFAITYRDDDDGINIHDPYPGYLDHKYFFTFNEMVDFRNLFNRKDVESEE